MSKHGGSPSSGLVLPVGLEHLKPEVPNGMVLVPQEVVDAREQAKKREERAFNLERRRLALELLSGGCEFSADPLSVTKSVERSLLVADELIKQTGGGI